MCICNFCESLRTARVTQASKRIKSCLFFQQIGVFCMLASRGKTKGGWFFILGFNMLKPNMSNTISIGTCSSDLYIHYFFPKQFTVGVLNAVLSVSALAGVLCPPRRACLLSPNLSPNVSPTWLCLSPWLGCCVRLSGLVSGLVSQFVSHLALSPSFVSPFVSHLALSFTLAGVLCPPRWGCLPICVQICLPSGFVSQFCLPICSHLALSFTFRWACLRICLPMCLPSGFVPVLSPNLFPIWLCLSPWLGCCVRLVGLVS